MRDLDDTEEAGKEEGVKKKRYRNPRVRSQPVMAISLACNGQHAKQIGFPTCPKVGS